MSGINKVILVGRLGKDPETKSFDSGSSITNFTVATSESWTDKAGEKVEKTEWHRVSAFGKLAELAGKYLVKGKQVYIEGKIKTREYEKDGVKKYSTDIIADKIEFLGDSKQNVESTPENNPAHYQKATQPTAKPKVKNHAPGADNSHLTNDEFGF